jgi:mycofactocin system glycosyltransferase
VLVVDDASNDPIGPVAGVQVLRLRTNTGPAVARNGGLAAVTTPLVAFLDTDVVPTEGWLEPLLAHFADPRVGLVAPRVASAPGTGRLARYEQRHSSLDLGEVPGRIAPGTRISYVPAAALLARTAALREIDGFDRSLRVGEDVDAVWRLAAAGWRCRYVPASVVHHRPRASWRRFTEQRVAYGSSAAPLAQRHPGALSPLRVSGWSAGVWGLLAIGQPIAAVGVAATTAGALVRKLPGVPARESVRLAALGHLNAGRQIAEATRRTWWPFAIAGSLVSKRVRTITAIAAVTALADGGPARLADDVAYGVGVWKGALASGEFGPLRPDLRSWPGRRGVAS